LGAEIVALSRLAGAMREEIETTRDRLSMISGTLGWSCGEKTLSSTAGLVSKLPEQPREIQSGKEVPTTVGSLALPQTALRVNRRLTR
jgi:hypothetical protein